MSIRHTEETTGIHCPFGLEDPFGFDKVASAVLLLCDVEQFALKSLLHASMRLGNVRDYVPNSKLMYDVIEQLDEHVLENGGMDVSESPENLAYLECWSVRVTTYMAQHERTKPVSLKAA